MKREMNFENFYVYEGNKVAFLAAQKIIEFPGELFNPLYIHGSTGIGKTHIAWALYNAMSAKGAVNFFTAKDFEQHLLQKKSVDGPLIVDDIHAIDISCHAKLLSIIDRYLTNNTQLCFTGNAAPRDLTSFDDKLLSRLEGGLVCDIQPPKEMALIDLIKQKSDEAGILLADEIALELAQISTGSIRTIEGMINRLVAYSSLGNMTLDVNTVHMILKEFYPKGIYSPVSSLLEELKKNASEVLQDVSTKLDIREEYREKIYVWQMKGFDTSSLTMLLDGDVEVLKREYETFISKVERLIDLQKQYGALDLHDHPDEAMQIESMLFSPDKADEIEVCIKQFVQKPISIDRSRSFDSYIKGPCNERAVEIYQKQVREYLGERYNPFIVFGDPGVGKTRFLEAVFLDLEERGKEVYFHDCTSGDKGCDWKTVEPSDVIVLDNFHMIIKAPEPVHVVMFEILDQAIKHNKAVILSSVRITGDAEWGSAIRSLFDMGIEVEILSPDSATAIEYLEPRLTPMQYEQAVSQGVPHFASFGEIDSYISSITEVPQEVVSIEAVTDVESAVPDIGFEVKEKEDIAEALPVSLGLPGEEVTPEQLPEEQEEFVALGLPGEQAQDEDSPGQGTEAKEQDEVVALGLPGEEVPGSVAKTTVPASPEQTEKVEESEKKGISEPLKAIHEERFIIHEIMGEMVEDNY
jgi:chromosomal replication initiation ATPase DnaA